MEASSPPFIPVPSLPNLRDIGGYQIASTSTPRSVRRKLFFRAADPSKCDANGIRQLRDELGISTIFDIRAKPEMERNINTDGDVAAWEKRLADVSEDGNGTIQRIWVPVFKEEDYGPEQVALRYQMYGKEGTEVRSSPPATPEIGRQLLADSVYGPMILMADPNQGFARAYEAILKHGVPNFNRILKHIAYVDTSKPKQGILIHCTAGKDRTGVFVAVLLSLLGVDDETIAYEYTLTEVGLKEMKPYFLERIMANETFQKPDGPGRAGAERMVTCTKENMLATLEMMRREYGSAEGYVLNACGLSKDEMEAVKRILTMDGKNSAL